VAQTLKICKGYNQSIVVWASKPYVQQYGILCVRNAQLEVHNRGIERVWQGIVQCYPRVLWFLPRVG
jgi:hypothetical protein